MRTFNDTEKDMIDKLCSLDNHCRESKIAISRPLIFLIEEMTGISKLEWNKQGTKLCAYSADESKIQEAKYKFVDFIALIKWLDKNGYVYLINEPKTIKKDRKGLLSITTDRTGYCFLVFSMYPFQHNLENGAGEKYEVESNVEEKEQEHEENNDAISLPAGLIKDVIRIASSYILVTENLKVLKNNGYKTLEQKEAEEANKWSKFNAAIAFIVGVASIIIGACKE